VEIEQIDGLHLAGVSHVVTGERVKQYSRSFIAGVRGKMEHYSLALNRVRYVGDSVAVAIAKNSSIAEDTLAEIYVGYRQRALTLHAVMLLALAVPANKLRLQTSAHLGGSFGVKQAVSAFFEI
jgi:CO/xanthine dehydrogenase Mo-binding subunit